MSIVHKLQDAEGCEIEEQRQQWQPVWREVCQSENGQ
jgi:hypothetical protein